MKGEQNYTPQSKET